VPTHSLAGKNRSQLSVIFEVIGTPQLDDLPHLDENTAQLLSNLPTRSAQVRYNMDSDSVLRCYGLLCYVVVWVDCVNPNVRNQCWWRVGEEWV
jgi:hypothetical protein